MTELPSNGDPNLPPGVTPAMIDEHYGGEDGEECGTCYETVHPCDIEQICCTCSADRERRLVHQQWLLDNQRKPAKEALDILRKSVLPITGKSWSCSPVSDWITLRAATQNAIEFLEFASGRKAPETTAEDVVKGLKIGQAATPPGN